MPFYMVEGTAILELGSGDVLIWNQRGEGSEFDNQIGFSLDNDCIAGEVGHAIKDGRWAEEFAGKYMSELNVPLQITFSNVAALDAMLDSLQRLRDSVEENGTTL